MIGYVTVGTNDMAKAVPFFDAVLAELGAKPAFDTPRGGRLYTRTEGRFEFGVNPPFDGNEASVGNGSMVALAAETQDQVRGVYAKAMEMGGACEGEPGWRGPEGGFYGAYFRDLDGNKLCIYRMGPA